MSERVLYQFPISHYCEKARWVLDYKRLAYRIHNQLPGPHGAINTWRTGKSSVPLLRDGSVAISGSQAIALYLEQQQLGPSLLPRTVAGRALHDQIVQHFDAVIGPAVRRYLYRFVLPRTALFRQKFFAEYRGMSKLIGHVIAGPISKMIGEVYDVHAEEAAALPDLFRRTADDIEARLGTARYLIDDTFSLADITVASLFGPLLGPARSPWAGTLDVPELQRLRDELNKRPIGRWSSALYEERP